MPENDQLGSERRAPKVLVVDDSPLNTTLIRDQLEDENYQILIAMNGPDALEITRQQMPDLILLDVMMPGMSGVEVAQAVRADAQTEHIPIVMVTALGDRDSKMLALRNGATEFLLKPVDRAELLVRVRNLLRMKQYQDELAQYARLLEARVAERTEQLRASYRETILALTRAAEYKDEETGEHVRRISHYSSELARRLGMDTQFCDEIFHASPMHDVGKIGIPDSILLKPGKLDADEWTRMKTHTTLGARMLLDRNSPYVSMGADIALCHHERWDGSGYPNGLAGEEIPLHARIMALGDVYDALRSRRPYKEPFSHARAVEIITKGDGRTMPQHFDPEVRAAFERIAHDFDEIFCEWSDQEQAAQ